MAKNNPNQALIFHIFRQILPIRVRYIPLYRAIFATGFVTFLSGLITKYVCRYACTYAHCEAKQGFSATSVPYLMNTLNSSPVATNQNKHRKTPQHCQPRLPDFFGATYQNRKNVPNNQTTVKYD
jgi:hypothetical protein